MTLSVFWLNLLIYSCTKDLLKWLWTAWRCWSPSEIWPCKNKYCGSVCCLAWSNENHKNLRKSASNPSKDQHHPRLNPLLCSNSLTCSGNEKVRLSLIHRNLRKSASNPNRIGLNRNYKFRVWWRGWHIRIISEICENLRLTLKRPVSSAFQSLEHG